MIIFSGGLYELGVFTYFIQPALLFLVDEEKVMKKTMKEIQVLLQKEPLSNEVIKQLYEDERKGVQKLLQRWEKRQKEIEKQKETFLAMSTYENQLREDGILFIAGIDEVGRGPLAGPVVAAAVILPENFYLLGLDDSKKLSEKKREEYFDYIQANALAIGIGVVSNKVIDTINIYQATKQAMNQALENLSIEPNHLLIDAMELEVNIPQTAIIKGDSNSISIAAASIIAKVTRDRMMKELGEKYPEYGFEKHMGYGTKAHLLAVEKHGVLSEHRLSFAPIKEMDKN